VSWNGAAYALFQPLPAAGKKMLKKADLYHAIRSPNSNQPANTYNVTDLADPAFSRGSLFPGLYYHNAWPSFLTQLYTSVHEYFRYAASLVGSNGALATQIFHRMHRCNEDFEDFLKKHDRAIPLRTQGIIHVSCLLPECIRRYVEYGVSSGPILGVLCVLRWKGDPLISSP
jgi:hypothetical protein